MFIYNALKSAIKRTGLSFKSPSARPLQPDCIGIVRFSVISTTFNKFKAAKGLTFQEYAEVILDDARLENRFLLFETITIPSFAAQTDKAFRLLVVAPRLLGEKWRERLDRIAASFDFVKILYVDETDFRMSDISTHVSKLIGQNAKFFSTFRVDDDDALRRDFVKRLRKYHKAHFVGYGISFSKGYYLDVDTNNLMFKLTPKQRINTGAGLALIAKLDDPKTLFDLSDGHLNFHTHRPVIVDGRHDAFLVLNHDGNDTGSSRHSGECTNSVVETQAKLSSLGFEVVLSDLAGQPK